MAEVPGNVKVILTDSDFQKELIVAADKLVVVGFFATWSGPCKQMAPKFYELSMKYLAVMFIKLDVEICRNTAKRYEVSAMPTFVFFKNREKLHTVRGADVGSLESGIIQHLGSSSSSEQAATTTSITVPGQINLLPLVDKNGSECLNESDSHPFRNALTAGKEYLESDCDEQLILVLAFQQPVKLHSLQIVGPPDGRAPKTVKLFINQLQTMDFDAAEQRKPLQQFELTEKNIKPDSILPLAYVKFQNVQSLTLFIQDNQGGEETTVINHIGLFGTPLDSTNMKEFKRVAGEKGETHD